MENSHSPPQSHSFNLIHSLNLQASVKDLWPYILSAQPFWHNADGSGLLDFLQSGSLFRNEASKHVLHKPRLNTLLSRQRQEQNMLGSKPPQFEYSIKRYEEGRLFSAISYPSKGQFIAIEFQLQKLAAQSIELRFSLQLRHSFLVYFFQPLLKNRLEKAGHSLEQHLALKKNFSSPQRFVEAFLNSASSKQRQQEAALYFRYLQPLASKLGGKPVFKKQPSPQTTWLRAAYSLAEILAKLKPELPFSAEQLFSYRQESSSQKTAASIEFSQAQLLALLMAGLEQGYFFPLFRIRCQNCAGILASSLDETLHAKSPYFFSPLYYCDFCKRSFLENMAGQKELFFISMLHTLPKDQPLFSQPKKTTEFFEEIQSQQSPQYLKKQNHNFHTKTSYAHALRQFNLVKRLFQNTPLFTESLVIQDYLLIEAEGEGKGKGKRSLTIELLEGLYTIIIQSPVAKQPPRFSFRIKKQIQKKQKKEASLELKEASLELTLGLDLGLGHNAKGKPYLYQHGLKQNAQISEFPTKLKLCLTCDIGGHSSKSRHSVFSADASHNSASKSYVKSQQPSDSASLCFRIFRKSFHNQENNQKNLAQQNSDISTKHEKPLPFCQDLDLEPRGIEDSKFFSYAAIYATSRLPFFISGKQSLPLHGGALLFVSFASTLAASAVTVTGNPATPKPRKNALENQSETAKVQQLEELVFNLLTQNGGSLLWHSFQEAAFFFADKRFFLSQLASLLSQPQPLAFTLLEEPLHLQAASFSPAKLSSHADFHGLSMQGSALGKLQFYGSNLASSEGPGFFVEKTLFARKSFRSLLLRALAIKNEASLHIQESSPPAPAHGLKQATKLFYRIRRKLK